MGQAALSPIRKSPMQKGCSSHRSAGLLGELRDAQGGEGPGLKAGGGGLSGSQNYRAILTPG